MKIHYLAASLGPLQGTRVGRGTPVENHCLSKYYYPAIGKVDEMENAWHVPG